MCKFDYIYSCVIKHWPELIDISNTDVRDDNGAYIPALSQAWDKVENVIGDQNEWHSLMVWSMFCVFHRLCRDQFLNMNYSFYPHQVSQALIKTQFYLDISAPNSGYEDMKEEYIRKNH